MKLFPNFTSIPFDYLLISWGTNYLSNRGYFTCLSWIVSIDRELHSLKGVWKSGKSESGIGTGIGTGSGIGTGMGRETYIKTGTTFNFI